MADDKNLTQVTGASALADTDIMPVVQTGTAIRRATLAQLRTWLGLGIVRAFANGSAALRAYAQNFHAAEIRRADDSANPSSVSLEKSRGTIASPTVIQAGDGIASVAGRAWDGSAWTVGAQFRFDCSAFAGAGNFTTRFQLQLRTGTGLSTVMAVDPNGVTTFTSLSEFGVGIQTTTASAQTLLLSQPVATFDNTSPALANGLGLRFRIADTGGTLRNAAQIQAIAAAKTGSAITPRLAILVGITERATILDDGNVGIGTTTPSERLHVFGGNSITERSGTEWVSHIISSGAGALKGIFYQSSRLSRWAFVSTQETESGSNAGSNFGINRYTDAGGFIERVISIIRSTGNVGIGVDNPTARFHVAGPIRHATFTVATLPAAATVGAGTRAAVTDANATTFNAVAAGGGANFVPVISDGTNWRIG